MEMFRKEIIDMFQWTLEHDEYNDVAQRHEHQILFTTDSEEYKFVTRNLILGNLLEIGCGGGLSLSVFPITHAVEPSKHRFKQAKEYITTNNMTAVLEQAVAECLPFSDKYFDNVLSMASINHFRSDFEALIEMNRVLKTDGRLILILPSMTKLKYTFPPLGRLYHPRQFATRVCEDFGFELIELREKLRHHEAGLAFEKARDFHPSMLIKEQKILVDKDKQLYRVLNPTEEWLTKIEK